MNLEVEEPEYQPGMSEIFKEESEQQMADLEGNVEQL